MNAVPVFCILQVQGKTRWTRWTRITRCTRWTGHRYSLVHLVLPNTEELISQPFMGLSKIRLLLQDPVSPRYVRFFWRYHIFHLLFCPTHAHIIRSSMGVAGRICSEAGRLDLFAEKSNRPASEQIIKIQIIENLGRPFISYLFHPGEIIW